MNPQRTPEAIVILALLAVLASGCTAEPTEPQTDSLRASPLAVITGATGPSIMSGCTSNQLPPDCEIRTIRIQQTVGMFFIPRGTDADTELERMDAVLVGNGGALYESIVGR